jgi:glycine cleavage system protein P-like pyridoxal-binding family
LGEGSKTDGWYVKQGKDGEMSANKIDAVAVDVADGLAVGRITYPETVGQVEGLIREVGRLKAEVDRVRDENQYLHREIAAMDDYVSRLRAKAV